MNYQAIVTALESKCLASGKFRTVNGHEPKNAPEKGLTAAVWVDNITPFSGRSGLATTSAVVSMMIRLYTPMLSEPQDAIDPALVTAADVLLSAIQADLDLGSTVANVDVFGANGTSLNSQAGYVEVGGTLFRVIDITVPCLLNDAWTQGA